MTTQELVRKLGSRKFWSFVATFVTSILMAFNMEDNQIAQVIAIISAFGSMAVYVLAEAYIDGKYKTTDGEVLELHEIQIKDGE